MWYCMKIIFAWMCAVISVAMAMDQNIINQFKEVAEDGRLEEILEKHSTCNIKSGTLGGKHCWTTYSSGEWRLQVNKYFGNWRILDAEDNRLAWGVRDEGLRSLLNDQAINTFTNYLDSGANFSQKKTAAPTKKAVILIHGWGVRAKSMQALADALADKGYDTYNYDYCTSKYKIDEHVDIFLEKYRELIKSFPADEKIFFLTHSMGGLVLRGAMAKMTEDECRRISAIVMLGPPNLGSKLAYFSALIPFNKSLGDMAPDDESYVMNIPAPTVKPPVCIVAGRYDGKVAIKNTYLPDGYEFSFHIVKCTHPGLRKPANVLQYILAVTGSY